jgi:hypothetical protein
MKNISQSSSETQIPNTPADRANSRDQDPTIETDQRRSGTDPLSNSQTPQLPNFLVLPLQPEFPLEKGLGCWLLRHNGQHAILRSEIGLDYVAFLLAHPDEEFHGLALALKVRALRNGQPADSVDLLQERALALDDAEAARRLYRKQLDLENLVDDESTSEPVREEAQRELLAIYEFQKKNVARTNNMASKASHSVGMAIKRLHRRLANAADETGHPHLILRAFAQYVQKHILVPSGRGMNGGTRLQGQGGNFIHRTAGDDIFPRPL